MFGLLTRAALGAGLVAVVALAFAQERAAATEAKSAHDFAFTSIDGAPLPLSAYRGKVMLVVNTASFCGFTYQYEGLQALWDARRDKDFVLIGAPSGDFGGQEYADEKDVKNFCEATFAVDFPLTEIVSVRGRDAHPFFAYAGDKLGAPSWNFTKYLVDREGRVVKRFGSSAEPEAVAREDDRLLGAS